MKTKAEKICALVSRMTVAAIFIARALERHAVSHNFSGYDWDEYTMADGSIVRWDDSGFTVAAA